MDRKVYEAAVISSRQHLTKRARKYSRNASDIEDLASEAILILLERPGWENIQNVTYFGLGVVDNLGRNYVRKQQGKREHEIPLDAVVATLPAPDISLEESLINRDQSEEYIATIRAAICSAGLSKSERCVIESLLTGRDYTEIAEATDLKRESVATYYSNALGKIRRVIGG